MLVQHPRNLGYGEALKSGFRSATMDLVFLTDADNQFDLDELEDFLELIEHADVVAGHRIHRSDPWFRRVNGHGLELPGPHPVLRPGPRRRLRLQAVPPRGVRRA